MPSLVSFDNPALKVVKASAGSGKTHRLTGEYLRLLFDSDYAYKHILAVTFTNKATDEMKSRIVSELARLALDHSSDYLQALMEERKMPEEAIRLQSKKILVNILHDYSSFSISTIDKFFQQTMRAFTREIGLGGGYNVELDQDKVLDAAIDTLFSDLENPENKELLGWLIRFSEENIEDGKGWEVRKNIHSLAREIFKENYKTLVSRSDRDELDKDLLNEYKKELSAIIGAYENRLKQLGEKAINILQRYHLRPDSFKFGSTSGVGVVEKWAKGIVEEPKARLIGLQDNLDVWYTKTTPADVRGNLESAYPEFNECIKEAIQHYTGNRRAYATAYEINRYFFTLGILSDIDKKVREYCAENNVMLISDTTELLSKIIEGTDTPFVYEKIGSRVEHYMIDEFQDTSSLQWANFLPLVRNSLSSGNMNLIVGDVKQSIYRWRNSDWKLLNEQLDIDFRNEGVFHDSLNVNWRSTKNVIEFNNSVFKTCASLLQENYNQKLPELTENADLISFSHKIEDAYLGLEQIVPAKSMNKEGHVKVEFLEDDEERDWKEQALHQLPSLMENLQDKGYALKDISVLVRTKAEGFAVANCLLEYKSRHADSPYKYDIISDEALVVANSDNVKAVIAMLQYIKNPLDENRKALAVYEFKKQNHLQDIATSVRQYLNVDASFSEEEQKLIEHIAALPLYEMVEGIFGMLHDDESYKEDIYIQAFLDLVLDFTVGYSSDTDAFLRWWEESGFRKTVFTPDNQDAIRIMTIHKSKGLGFGVVVIPFCNWNIDNKNSEILWCSSTLEPFNKVNPVPVRYSSKLVDTIFSSDYYNEKIHAYIDNLNVLYVAFTRAKSELYAFAPRPSSKGKKGVEISDIASLLWLCLQADTSGDSLMNTSDFFDPESLLFEAGADYRPAFSPEEKTVEEIPAEKLVSISFEDRLKLRLGNKYFFSEDGQREFGSLMHEIVSEIETQADLPVVLDKYVDSGDITLSERIQMETEIEAFFLLPGVADWYSGRMSVKNEIEILLPDGNFVRPDRVMILADSVVVIDYKFGEKEERKYGKQVAGYIHHIREIGYKQVTGYVCYVKLGKIVEIPA